MSETNTATVTVPASKTNTAGSAAPESKDQQPRGRSAGLRQMLSFRNISAIYIFIGLFILFSLWVPSTFLTWGVWKSLLVSQALDAIVAIAVVLPLAAGVFDLAVGAEMGFAGVVVAWFLSKLGIPVVPAIALALLAGGLLGATSGLIIVRYRVDSFITTLAMSSILLALTDWVSSSQQILNLGHSFQSVGTASLFGLTTPFWFVLVMAAVVWYVLERTPIGRRIYATGGNINAARLIGVKTPRVVVLCFAACGVIAATAGILQSSVTATGDPTVGPPFLLPAYAAAFLGSTQFRGGRYNIWGTVLAVYVLATGVQGLELAGAPTWIPNLFDGVALLVAVAMAKSGAAGSRYGAVRMTFARFFGSKDASAAERPAGDLPRG